MRAAGLAIRVSPGRPAGQERELRVARLVQAKEALGHGHQHLPAGGFPDAALQVGAARLERQLAPPAARGLCGPSGNPRSAAS